MSTVPHLTTTLFENVRPNSMHMNVRASMQSRREQCCLCWDALIVEYILFLPAQSTFFEVIKVVVRTVAFWRQDLSEIMMRLNVPTDFCFIASSKMWTRRANSFRNWLEGREFLYIKRVRVRARAIFQWLTKYKYQSANSDLDHAPSTRMRKLGGQLPLQDTLYC